MLARPDRLPLFAIPLDENGFVDWLIDAKPGDTLVYYRGHLSHDRMKELFTPARTVETGKPAYELIPPKTF